MKARNFIFFTFVFFFLNGALRSQVMTTLYVDVLGNQPVQVDTMSGNGKTEMFTKDAEKQFAIGFRMYGLNLERSLHIGVLFAYRRVTLENLNLLNSSNANRYEMEGLFEFMGGVNYFTRRGYTIGKMHCHFSLNGYAGVQNTSFGSTLGGGLTFLSDKGVAGVTIEFVYRPVAYKIDNKSEVLNPDPYYVTLHPSYALKLGFAFGRNLQYGD